MSPENDSKIDTKIDPQNDPRHNPCVRRTRTLCPTRHEPGVCRDATHVSERHNPCVRNLKMTISLETCLKNDYRHNPCVRETRPLCLPRHEPGVCRDTNPVSERHYPCVRTYPPAPPPAPPRHKKKEVIIITYLLQNVSQKVLFYFYVFFFAIAYIFMSTNITDTMIILTKNTFAAWTIT